MQADEQKITDADILRLIAEFGEWRTEVGVSANGGLWQMLVFLRESIQSGEGLYVPMLDRQRQHAREMAVYALDHPYDAALAADYLSEALHGNPVDLDYDGAFLFCGDYINTISNLMNASSRPQLGATYNTIFSFAVRRRLTGYWIVYRGGNPEPAETFPLSIPVIVDILHLGFNIPMFVDSMQLGQGAWGAGERIALVIDRHIRSARSQGQLCSLYPRDIPVPVDWRRNTWASKSELLDYLDQPFRGNEPLPEWAKDWMKNGTA
ncbi:hypothetical protein JJJ17_11960 [Paracoccus caeni]|uniref:Uncharacterized protein n=1 Tax=Paracoccus caeni TaxID=657651 RepID=A0A934SEY4_9RHOB|nr:hypothetical protein [Paracoccus caeni]MBK4216642.1 hypothetical protein [Paracoccus caeni]